MPKKNKKNRNKKKKKQIIEEPVNKSRRNVLKLTAGTAALALVGFGGYQIYNHLSYDEWNFLKRTEKDVTLKSVDWEIIEKQFVPFGRPETMVYKGTQDSIELQNLIKKAATEEIKKRGYDMGAQYNVDCWVSLYGVPSPKEIAKSTVNYCKKAVEFMYDKLPNLDKHDMEFVILGNMEDHTKNHQSKIFIADSYYRVAELKITNPTNPEQTFTLKTSNNRAGAFSFPTVRKSTKSLEEWYAFIGAYNVALVAPFSELIPLTTSIGNAIYCESHKIDNFEAHQMEETISESLSHILGMQIVKKLDIPNGKNIIQTLDNCLFQKPMYKYVPQAIKWIQKNGMQEALDCYIENPKKFMKLIKSS